MQMNKQITRSRKDSNTRIAPAKFNILLIMAASVMLFAAFTSAYLVHRPDAITKDTWTVFALPMAFFYSALVAFVSSITIWLAYRAAKQDEIGQIKIFTTLTFLLGVAFCVLQYVGYQDMVARNLFLVNPEPKDISASFVYVISFVHLVHLLGGMVLLAVLLVRTFQFKVHKKSLTFASVTHTYWHFVGLLWIYLYLFLYFAR